MNDEAITEVFDRLLKVAEILKQTSDQFDAMSHLMQRMQWQIIDLDKRINSLEAIRKEQPVT